MSVGTCVNTPNLQNVCRVSAQPSGFLVEGFADSKKTILSDMQKGTVCESAELPRNNGKSRGFCMIFQWSWRWPVAPYWYCVFPLCSTGCDMCADNRNGECPMHGPLHSLRRLVGTSSAAAAAPPPEIPEWLRDLPREVCLCTSTVPGLAYGICAAQRIQQGTWIGPFQGVLLLPEKVQAGAVRNTQHLWEVSHHLSFLLKFYRFEADIECNCMYYQHCFLEMRKNPTIWVSHPSRFENVTSASKNLASLEVWRKPVDTSELQLVCVGRTDCCMCSHVE